MCLGASARAANENAREQYKYNVEKRKRTYLNKRDVYKAKGVQYKQALSAINRGANRSYVKSQKKLNRLRGRALSANQKRIEQLYKKSPGLKAIAAGRTGKSINRTLLMDMASVGRYSAATASRLRSMREDADAGMARIYDKVKNQFNKERAGIALAPMEAPLPAPPAMRDVGYEAFTEGLSIAGSAMSIAGGFGVFDAPVSGDIDPG